MGIAPERISLNEIIVNTVSNGFGGSFLALSLTPAQVNAQTAAEQNFTVAGLVTTDLVIPMSNNTGNNTALVTARVSAADTLTCKFTNPTAGNLTPGAGTYNFLVIRTV